MTLATRTPGIRLRVSTSAAVSRRNAARNRTTFKTSDTAMPATTSSGPPRPPVTAPDAAEEKMNRTPRDASTPRPRSRACRKLGRRLWGTAQTLLNAFWLALVTARPPQSDPASPITSELALPCSACTLFLMSLPMIGNCPSTPFLTESCALGSPWRTNPSTVTNTSSSGNSEKNP